MHQLVATALPSSEHNAHHDFYSCMHLKAYMKHFHVEMHGLCGLRLYSYMLPL